MLEELNNEDVLSAIGTLASCLGVKEDVPPDELVSLLHEGGIESCAQQIAVKLGLPININLSMVLAGTCRGNSNGFRSSDLTRTDSMGHGVAGIIAQVSIPDTLPHYGSSNLKGFSINVRVSKNCCNYPYTFIAIMAHELSHVLLSCLYSPFKESELHTDIVPILLGFRESIRRGRQTSFITTQGNITTTQTTRYGYLTDDHFEIACAYANKMLDRYMHQKSHLCKLIKHVRNVVENARNNLSNFRGYLKFIGRHPPRRMNPQHAQRVVYLYSHDESIAWESSISALSCAAQTTADFADSLNHYTASSAEDMTIRLNTLKTCLDGFSGTQLIIEQNLSILKNYVGLFHRLKNMFRIPKM